jgi:hypothetical protein
MDHKINGHDIMKYKLLEETTICYVRRVSRRRPEKEPRSRLLGADESPCQPNGCLATLGLRNHSESGCRMLLQHSLSFETDNKHK